MKMWDFNIRSQKVLTLRASAFTMKPQCANTQIFPPRKLPLPHSIPLYCHGNLSVPHPQEIKPYQWVIRGDRGKK